MAEKQQPQSTITYLSNNKPWKVCLITYSHLDKENFPTRGLFGRACAMTFGGNKVLHFACSREAHKVTNAERYFVAIQLNPSQKGKTTEELLYENYGIVANFASSKNGGKYVGAYRCAVKEDPKIFHCNCLEKHPELSMIGKSKNAALANAAYGEKRKSINEDLEIASQQNKTKKLMPKRMDKLDIVQYIWKGKIVTLTELMAPAESRRKAGDAELARVILKMTQKRGAGL